MSKKNKNKEVKEEVKAEVAIEAESKAMDCNGVEYVPCPNKQKTILDLAHEVKQNLEELMDFDINHHNKAVIDLAVSKSLETVKDLISSLVFIEKAAKEKKK